MLTLKYRREHDTLSRWSPKYSVPALVVTGLMIVLAITIVAVAFWRRWV